MKLFSKKHEHINLMVDNINQSFIEFQLDIKFKNVRECAKYCLSNELVDPMPEFSSEAYLQEHHDVRSASIHPYLHFLMYGKEEGRHIFPSKVALEYENSSKLKLQKEIKIESSTANKKEIDKFNALQSSAANFFDQEFYENSYPGVWGWEHYAHYGQYENRVPNKNVVPEVLEKYFRSSHDSIPLIDMLEFAKIEEGKSFDDKPIISVIILNWNKSLMTLQCVYTLFKNSYYENLEIIIVDNGSVDTEYSKLIELRAHPRVKLIRNRTNRFYGEANNIGVEAASSQYICLLNNDAFVGKHWDKYLLNELLSGDSVGGVGPKFLFPNGKLQEAGGVLNPCGQNVQIGKGLDPKLPFFNRNADVTHVSAACFVLEKSLFNRINGFDYRYEPAYFEDADLTAKISSLGYKIRYVPKAEVIHVENATSKDPEIGFNFGSLIGANRMKFVEKWGDYLRDGEAPPVPDFTLEYDKKEITGTNGKVAVIYSPYQLTPGGGERYVLSLAIAARDSGYETYFCSPERYTKYRLHTVAFELGLDANNIGLLGEEQLEKQDISLFIAMSNELSPAIKAKGKDKNIYHCQFPFPMSDWHKSNCLNNVSEYDVVIVNSEFTAQAYKREASKYFVDIPPIEVISPPVDMIENICKPDDGVIRVLNVGRFIAGGHCKKQLELVKAFNLFSTELAKKDIKAELTLMGSLSASEEDRNYLEQIRQLTGNNVSIILNGSRQDIIKNYQNANFYWHGTGIGEDVTKKPHLFEHFGITPVEAMSAGCVPVVWHEGGPKEVLKQSLNNYEEYIATSITEYSEKSLYLLTKDNPTLKVDVFSEGVFQKKLEETING